MPELRADDVAALLDELPLAPRLRRAAADAPAYLVGGAVRDLLLGRDLGDLDVVVEGDAEAFAARLGDVARRHERFGTVSALICGHAVDVAAARAESYPHPGALPVVRPATLAEDLGRRDFTVNAMALPLGGGAGLIDPHGGLDDLGAGVLRVLHASSFVDDPTRALRAARYAARFGFELEPGTAALLAEADLGAVSSDRFEAELRRLAREPEPERGFGLLADWGLVTIPDSALELIARLGSLPARWSEEADVSAAIVAAALGRGADAERLAAARPGSPSEGVRLATGSDPAELALARAAGAVWLDDYLARWRQVRLDIGGSDLLAAGVPEGPAIGRGLRAALEAKLDGHTGGRDDELRVALEAARAP